MLSQPRTNLTKVDNQKPGSISQSEKVRAGFAKELLLNISSKYLPPGSSIPALFEQEGLVESTSIERYKQVDSQTQELFYVDKKLEDLAANALESDVKPGKLRILATFLSVFVIGRFTKVYEEPPITIKVASPGDSIKILQLIQERNRLLNIREEIDGMFRVQDAYVRLSSRGIDLLEIMKKDPYFGEDFSSVLRSLEQRKLLDRR